MLLSYWDAGHIQLDVDDPTRPAFLGDTDFDFPDPAAPQRGLSPEGNAHYAEFSADGEWIIGTDEDISPYRVVLEGRNESFPALQAEGPRQLRPGEPLKPVETVFVGVRVYGDQHDGLNPFSHKGLRPSSHQFAANASTLHKQNPRSAALRGPTFSGGSS